MFSTAHTTQGLFEMSEKCTILTFAFSGRLPYTIGKEVADYSTQVIYEDRQGLQIPYSEGIFIDYLHFDKVCFMRSYVKFVQAYGLRNDSEVWNHASSLASVCHSRHSTTPA